MNEYLEQLFSLKGRVAIVTRASTELGKVVVRGLAQSGAIVCGVDGQILVEEGGESEASEPSSLEKQSKFKLLCDLLYQQHSKLNLLVNIEEIATPSASVKTIESATARDNNFRQAIELQLHNANQASQIAAKKIKQSGGGLIINIISIKNAMGFPDDFSYIATKNALLMITKKLAVDLIKDNIRVNNIVIGYVRNRTGSDKQIINLSDRSYQDLVGATIYLASENSGSITGQDIFIVGNRTITTLI